LDPRQENLDPFEAADDGEVAHVGSLGAKVKRRRRRSNSLILSSLAEGGLETVVNYSILLLRLRLGSI
jgi:hypothetical protein